MQKLYVIYIETENRKFKYIKSAFWMWVRFTQDGSVDNEWVERGQLYAIERSTKHYNDAERKEMQEHMAQNIDNEEMREIKEMLYENKSN
jgi:hypothetical protein